MSRVTTTMAQGAASQVRQIMSTGARTSIIKSSTMAQKISCHRDALNVRPKWGADYFESLKTKFGKQPQIETIHKDKIKLV